MPDRGVFPLNRGNHRYRTAPFSLRRLSILRLTYRRYWTYRISAGIKSQMRPFSGSSRSSCHFRRVPRAENATDTETIAKCRANQGSRDSQLRFTCSNEETLARPRKVHVRRKGRVLSNIWNISPHRLRNSMIDDRVPDNPEMEEA